MPYLTAMAEFRDSIREHARNLKATDILKVCDNLRDEILPNMGVRLEDREGRQFLRMFLRSLRQQYFFDSRCSISCKISR